MKTNIKALLLIMGLSLYSCSSENVAEEETSSITTFSKTTTPVSNSWAFYDLNQWTDASQNGTGNYQIEDGKLNIFTHPNTWERSKVKTISSFAAGTYSWNVYVPEMGVGDMASIGAFLYNDNAHELDFEIGYGSADIRAQLSAESDDLIVYMSSQANPFYSLRKKIKRNQWYNLKLELTVNSKSKYIASWKIDDQVMATTQLTYGDKTKFNIFCSVENLQFMGDHIPQNQNYALFDSVSFTGI